jgi:hypothetical protein
LIVDGAAGGWGTLQVAVRLDFYAVADAIEAAADVVKAAVVRVVMETPARSSADCFVPLEPTTQVEKDFKCGTETT